MVTFNYDVEKWVVTLQGGPEDEELLTSIRNNINVTDTFYDMNNKPTFLKEDIQVSMESNGNITVIILCTDRQGLRKVLSLLSNNFEVCAEKEGYGTITFRSKPTITNQNQQTLIFTDTTKNQNVSDSNCTTSKSSSSKPNS